jgi:hypothetical protein
MEGEIDDASKAVTQTATRIKEEKRNEDDKEKATKVDDNIPKV